MFDENVKELVASRRSSQFFRLRESIERQSASLSAFMAIHSISIKILSTVLNSVLNKLIWFQYYLNTFEYEELESLADSQ